MDAYRDQYARIFGEAGDVVLLAVSVDPLPELASWAAERGYPFRLLSDSGGVVGRRYGAWSATSQRDNRTLFVVAPGGRIVHVMAPFREIDPTAYDELAEAVRQSREGQ